MWSCSFTVLALLLLLTLLSAAQPSPSCKASLGSSDWPSDSKWTALNNTLSGRLLQPPPPGAVCHPDQPTYNAALCPTVTEEWFTVDFHNENPISVDWNNFNNDSCVPYLPPCSGEGYPVYVVNATTKHDVKKGVDFASANNVRLVVKASGHDYLGRSTAPNSLSIWTHSMKGLNIHDKSFVPRGCSRSIDGPAITFAAGTEMGELNLAASLKNLTVLSGGSTTVSYGGYVTGGGHAALSATYGLAADNALEFEMVTPGGDILTVNECQNRDLFWALRGGGGSTFGVITSTTIKAFPSVPFIVSEVTIGTVQDNPNGWDAMAYILSQYPALSAQGIAGYGNLYPNTTYGNLSVIAFQSLFLIPALSASNTSSSLESAIMPIIQFVNTTWPDQFQSFLNSTTYPSFYSWWDDNNGPNFAGVDLLVGSRLLDADALSSNLTALKVALQTSIPPGTTQSATLNFVSGKGVHNAVPRGGSNAVNPAWRKAIMNLGLGVTWNPLDAAAKAEQTSLLTNTYVEALRVLAPDSGAYLNEADRDEPNPHQSFWGDNYERLLAIKRRYDPEDVFWCTPCVGNERWEETGNSLCKIDGTAA